RNQVDLRRMIFAKLALRVGPGSVEIAESGPSKIVRARVMDERPLDRELRLTVAVDRPLGMRFLDRRLGRLSVSRAGGRKHEGVHPFVYHRLEHADRADDVVAVIAHGMTNRFADVEESGEVHDRRYLVVPQRSTESGDVGDVAFDERAVADRVAMAGAQVVEDHDAIASLVQRLGGVAADVPVAAGDARAAPPRVQWRNTGGRSL